MRKKRLSVVLLFILLTSGVWAEDYTLLMRLKSGQQERFVLAEKPVVRFSGNGIDVYTPSLSTSYRTIKITK